MRGEQDSQIELLTTTSPGKRAPTTHPIREIKRLADQALAKLDPVFDAMYSSIDRPSIPPEQLLKAQLLVALYSVRSERRFPFRCRSVVAVGDEKAQEIRRNEMLFTNLDQLKWVVETSFVCSWKPI